MASVWWIQGPLSALRQVWTRRAQRGRGMAGGRWASVGPAAAGRQARDQGPGHTPASLVPELSPWCPSQQGRACPRVAGRVAVVVSLHPSPWPDPISMPAVRPSAMRWARSSPGWHCPTQLRLHPPRADLNCLVSWRAQLGAGQSLSGGSAALSSGRRGCASCDACLGAGAEPLPGADSPHPTKDGGSGPKGKLSGSGVGFEWETEGCKFIKGFLFGLAYAIDFLFLSVLS